MHILLVGLNHKTAPVEIRERFTFTKGQLPAALKDLRDRKGIDGCAILTTCNRTEIYVSTRDVEQSKESIYEFIKDHCKLQDDELREYLYTKNIYDTVRHLFYVASGLDSMILGETQILGQIKDAYEVALENNTTNNIINTFFQHAITVGKKVRSETLIDQNPVSVSYVAVELARQYFKSLNNRTVLVIGAGEMSRLTAQYLLEQGVATVMVSNRSYDRAQELAKEFGGEAVKFSELFNRMYEADIVISATGARHYIIHTEDIENVMKKRKGKELFLVDIAVPRDIQPEVNSIDGVRLYDIDELQHVIDKNIEQKKKLAKEAEKIIESETDDFFKWLGTLSVVPTIASLSQKAEKIRQNELQRALNRLSPISEREKKVVSSMANSIVKQLLHNPIVNLKKAATNGQGHLYSEILQELFSLEVENQKKEVEQTKIHGKENYS